MDYNKLRQELDCHRPLVFFHDDPDGLASFLLLYRFIEEGKGVVVKSHPSVDKKFVKKVVDYHPDKVFILDLALVEDDFLDSVTSPVVWIDHHDPQQPRGTHYYNPRLSDDNIPAAMMCYEAVKRDLWIAMAGITGDWFYIPKLAKKFREQYPDLLPKGIDSPPQILFGTRLGELARVLSFILKGSTQEAMKYVKILTRVDSPYEILDQTTARGKFIYKRYEDINKEYQQLLRDSIAAATEDMFLTYVYPGNKMSFTGDLSNELLHRFPDKLIVVGRDKSGEVKCSMRSNPNVLLPPLIEKALMGLRGYGGGHEHACGVVVETDDFPRFMANLRSAMENSKGL